MLYLYISLGLLAFILIVFLFSFFVSLHVNKKAFNKRFDPNPLVRYYTPEEFNLSFEEVKFKLDTNEELVGAIYHYDNYDENKIVVYAHGMSSCTKSYIQDIEYLCKKGYQVLGFDYLATDKSQGESQKSFSHGLKSLDYAIRFIKSKFNNIDIYVIGHSWGGYNTLNVINYHPDIKKVIALAGFVTPSLALKRFIPNPFKFTSGLINLVEFIKNPKYGFNNSIKSLKKFKGEALLIHSDDDPTVLYDVHFKRFEKSLKNKDNIKFMSLTKKKHQPHYSNEAVDLLSKFSKDIKAVNPDNLVEFMNNTNFHKLGELDSKVMDEICEFIG